MLVLFTVSLACAPLLSHTESVLVLSRMCLAVRCAATRLSFFGNETTPTQEAALSGFGSLIVLGSLAHIQLLTGKRFGGALCSLRRCLHFEVVPSWSAVSN